MKKLLLATSALIIASSAQAADLGARPYTKAPVAAALPFNWTGCYVGGHIGGGASRTGFTDPAIASANPAPVTTIGLLPGDRIAVNGDVGVVGGVQVGCDYQFSNNWVIGLAGDFSGTDLHGVANDPFFAGKSGNPATLSSRTDWVASVTGRVGYTWDRFLVYGKGGVGFAHDRYSLNNFVDIGGALCPTGVFAFGPCNASTSTDRVGWVAGAGFEWAFAPNWSALVEYNHYGFDSKRVAFVNPAGSTALIDIKQDIDIVKVGINYRFGGSAIVAKY